MVVGETLYEMKNTAIILPRARRLLGLISNRLFSLIIIEVVNRGLVIKTK